jgi:hypothetical protein
MPDSPPTLRGAAAVQAVEALMVLAATILSAVDTAAGRSYQLASGIALSVIGLGCAVTLALVAAGLVRGRRWSRTPALLTQLFVGIVGIYLLEGHRLDWGLPSVLLAVAGFALLLAPPSMRALTGQAQPGQDGPGQDGPGQPGPGRGGRRAGDGQPGTTRRRSGRP